jgi:hypothetical protein
LQIEALEDRSLPSVSGLPLMQLAGPLTITTPVNNLVGSTDQVSIDRVPGSPAMASVTWNGATTQVNFAYVTSLDIQFNGSLYTNAVVYLNYMPANAIGRNQGAIPVTVESLRPTTVYLAPGDMTNVWTNDIRVYDAPGGTLGAGGPFHVTVNDQNNPNGQPGAPSTYTVTASGTTTSLQNQTYTLNLGGFSGFTFYAGNNSTVNVQSTSASTPLTIYTGTGTTAGMNANIVNLGSTTNRLDGLHSFVYVTEGDFPTPNATTTVNINDQGGTQNRDPFQIRDAADWTYGPGQGLNFDWANVVYNGPQVAGASADLSVWWSGQDLADQLTLHGGTGTNNRLTVHGLYSNDTWHITGDDAGEIRRSDQTSTNGSFTYQIAFDQFQNLVADRGTVGVQTIDYSALHMSAMDAMQNTNTMIPVYADMSISGFGSYIEATVLHGIRYSLGNLTAARLGPLNFVI